MESERLRVRALVIARDGNNCRACHCKENLTVHHLKRKSRYPELEFDPNNLITLCRKCHDDWHKMVRRKKEATEYPTPPAETNEWLDWATGKGEHPPLRKRKG
jgi:5-methylcytosine-specific restriction endonuclease McrA